MAVGDVVVDAATWQAAGRQAAEVIDAAHRAHPEHVGFRSPICAALYADDAPIDELFDPLLVPVVRARIRPRGSVVRRASHRPELPEPLQAAGAKLGQALAVKPLDPPSRKELAPDAVVAAGAAFSHRDGRGG